MSHALPALAAVLAVPLLGLAVHTASLPTGDRAMRAAANLPNNLCASCHGGGRAALTGTQPRLDAQDLMAARRLLQDAPRG